MTPVPIVAAVIQICGILLKENKMLTRVKEKPQPCSSSKVKEILERGIINIWKVVLGIRYVGTHLKSKHSTAGSTQDLYLKINNNKKFQKNFSGFIMF